MCFSYDQVRNHLQGLKDINAWRLPTRTGSLAPAGVASNEGKFCYLVYTRKSLNFMSAN